MRLYFYVPQENDVALGELGFYCAGNCAGYLTAHYSTATTDRQGSTATVFTDVEGNAISFPFEINDEEGNILWLKGFCIELQSDVIPQEKVQNIRNLSTFEGDASGLLEHIQY